MLEAKSSNTLFMNYKKIYDQLIQHAQARVSISGYTENHHIIPKALGGSDSKSNLVKLTLREHYIAHKLLCFIYPNSRELSTALWIMTITTLAAMNKMNNQLNKRVNSFISSAGKTITISNRDYELARNLYIKAKLGKKYTEEQKKNVSVGTRKAMRNKETIERTRKGSLGSHYYYDKITNQVFKWFPNDPPIDLNKYAWGRGHMSQEQRQKISDAGKLKKKYYYIPNLDIKYTAYDDFINTVPFTWKMQWANKKSSILKKYITAAVRQFNIDTDYKYDGLLILSNTAKSKNFKIITPGLLEVCEPILKFWKTKDITFETINCLHENIDLILLLNSKYCKNYELS